MGKITDIAGMTFGSWTVVALSDKPSRQARWLCQCECGTRREVVGTSLRFGASTNCGCKRRETIGAIRRVHGLSAIPEYRIWKHMRGRCFDTNDKRFSSYGGRGITVCEEWAEFSVFFRDMGKRPSPNHSIERLRVNGNYEPGNCVWATPKEQARNKVNTAYIQVGSRVGKLIELSEELGIPYDYLRKHAKRVAAPQQ